MSKGGPVDPERRLMIRTVILGTIVAAVSIIIVVYLRWTSWWANVFTDSPFWMMIPIFLMGLLYLSLLVVVGNLREMSRSVSGWFDVIALLIVVNVIAYLVYERLLYTGANILLCCGLILYLHFAQRGQH